MTMTVTIYKQNNLFLNTMGKCTHALNNGMFIAKYFAHPVDIFGCVHLPSFCPQQGGVESFRDHKLGGVGGFSGFRGG